jgi:hypothetical protein
MHPTPLRSDKIVDILKTGVCSIAFLLYPGGAGDGQAVGRPNASRRSRTSRNQNNTQQCLTRRAFARPITTTWS